MPTAWAPKSDEGTTEWLELTYPKEIYPTGVHIRETFNPGFVTLVEAFDSTTRNWRTLWGGKDTTLDSPATFSPPLSNTSMKTNRIRVSIDTNVPGRNEVDAVELVGRDTPTGWIVWSHGSWIEEGTAKLCDSRGCDDIPWENQPPHQWYWAFNTLTGKVGITPHQAR